MQDELGLTGLRGPEADDQLEGAPIESTVPCQFISGRAGVGKTYYIKERIASDSEWGLLSATTGIASVNLDAVTLNSVLRYFDTDSLRDAYLCGRLTSTLHQLGLEHRRLVIDEVSMMDRIQLDLIHRAAKEANCYPDLRDRPLGIVLCGDFCQLPPVKADWAFNADCWPDFASNTLRLTKVWRQEQAGFLDALDHLRSGRGEDAATALTRLGVEWRTSLDTSFDGTTIIPRNDAVDRFNSIALDGVRDQKFTVTSRRWGKLRSEWKNIPERTELKPGAYVMILANSPIDAITKQFDYVNGDCGHIESHGPSGCVINLIRTGDFVTVPFITRAYDYKDKPDEWNDYRTNVGTDEPQYLPRTHRSSRRRYVVGQVEYLPVRLAYATTIHKSQSLSLDRVQIDYRNQFFGCPGFLYVALSRCRTLEGLRLVGQRDVFARRCSTDPAVKEYL